MPRAGLEPARPKTGDFKSPASANSATRAISNIVELEFYQPVATELSYSVPRSPLQKKHCGEAKTRAQWAPAKRCG